MKKFNLLLSLIVIGVCMIFMTGCLGGGEPPPTFSISGFVYEKEKGLEGVTLTSDVGTTQTDENGYYTFVGLTTGITITAEKENYTFVKQSQTFFSETDCANFSALPFYSVSGYVKSGNLGVGGVKVTASGLKCGFTYSSDDGKFIIYNVAGDINLHA